MKTQTKMNAPKHCEIKIQCLAGKLTRLEFTDHKQAREVYDQLRNYGVWGGEAIRHIEFNQG
jgi:hypothetical protein